MASEGSKGRRLVGVSTKMYFTPQQTLQYLESLLAAQVHTAAVRQNIEFFLIPDYLSIPPCTTIIASHGTTSTESLMLGAQDCHYEDKGAFTGSISPLSLSHLGVQIVELGHAERRSQLGEDNHLVMHKALACERNMLMPLLCIGETERSDVASAVEEIRPQIVSVLTALRLETEVVLAYEPVWAIGASEPASPEYVVGVVRGLRHICAMLGRAAIRIVYGGSAGVGTWTGLAEASKIDGEAEGQVGCAIDGLFLGRFAHDVDNLRKVVEEVGTN